MAGSEHDTPEHGTLVFEKTGKAVKSLFNLLPPSSPEGPSVTLILKIPGRWRCYTGCQKETG
jgi:hypothetical protein